MEEKKGTGWSFRIPKPDDGRKEFLKHIDPSADGRLKRKLQGTGLRKGGQGRLLSLRRTTGKLGRATIGAATIRFFKGQGGRDPQPYLQNHQCGCKKYTPHRGP